MNARWRVRLSKVPRFACYLPRFDKFFVFTQLFFRVWTTYSYLNFYLYSLVWHIDDVLTGKSCLTFSFSLSLSRSFQSEEEEVVENEPAHVHWTILSVWLLLDFRSVKPNKRTHYKQENTVDHLCHQWSHVCQSTALWQRKDPTHRLVILPIISKPHASLARYDGQQSYEENHPRHESMHTIS